MTRKIFHPLLILTIALFTTVDLFAQHAKCTITGKVVDEYETPIAYASAALYNAATPIAGVVTDNDGKFSLKVSQSNEELRLVIEFIGYTRGTFRFSHQ